MCVYGYILFPVLNNMEVKTDMKERVKDDQIAI